MPVIDQSLSEDLTTRLFLFNSTPKLDGFLKSSAAHRAALGPAGSGKTEVCKFILWHRVMKWPGIKTCLFRKHRQDALSTVGADIQREFSDYIDAFDGKNDILRWAPPPNRRGAGDKAMVSTTYFRGFHEMQTRQRYGSFDIAFYWIAEAQELTEKDFVVARERIRQPGPWPVGGVLDGVSKEIGQDHWIYQYFVDEQRKDPENHHSLLLDFEDNVPNYIMLGRQDYVKQRQAAVEGDDLATALNLRSTFPPTAMRGPAVYPEYRPTRMGLYGEEPWHFTGKIIKPRPGSVFRGHDLAADTNYMACVWWQRQFGHVVVLRSLLVEGRGVKGYAEQVKAISDEEFPECVFRDRGDRMILAEEKVTGQNWTPQQMLAMYGIECQLGTQADWQRKAAVRELLTTTVDGLPKLIVSSRAMEFHRGMAGGYSKEKNPETGEYGKPKKNHHSHPVEAFEHSYAWESKNADAKDDEAPIRTPQFGGLR